MYIYNACINLGLSHNHNCFLWSYPLVYMCMQADSRKYITIADESSEYTGVAVLLIVVGIFVLIIGIVGAVGALFASKVFGRIILIVVS